MVLFEWYANLGLITLNFEIFLGNLAIWRYIFLDRLFREFLKTDFYSIVDSIPIKILFLFVF